MFESKHRTLFLPDGSRCGGIRFQKRPLHMHAGEPDKTVRKLKMNNLTVERIVRITEEYAKLDTALYGLGKILQELGYSKFARYGYAPNWFVHEIGTIDPTTKMMEVTFGGWVGESREEFEVKIPILWLQLEDPTEEIKFHMELAG